MTKEDFIYVVKKSVPKPGSNLFLHIAERLDAEDDILILKSKIYDILAEELALWVS